MHIHIHFRELTVLVQDIPDICLRTYRTARRCSVNVENPPSHHRRCRRASQTEVARAYGVSRSWLYEMLARYRAEGDTAFEPKPPESAKPRLLGADP
ncbi:MAG: Helix-turn-helix domain [Frondihabitans sp.]|nr:Helix-turn-helix domain [Frondihabitans sp.]